MPADHIPVETSPSLTSLLAESVSMLDLNDLVRSVVQLRHSAGSSNPVSLRLDLAADLPRIAGNTSKIQSALMSLFQLAETQALEAPDPAGKMTLRTSCRPYRVQVSVAVHHPWSFDPGANEPYNLEKSSSAIECCEIVHALGGELCLWRTGGSVWTFFMDLPASE